MNFDTRTADPENLGPLAQVKRCLLTHEKLKPEYFVLSNNICCSTFHLPDAQCLGSGGRVTMQKSRLNLRAYQTQPNGEEFIKRLNKFEIFIINMFKMAP